MLEGLAAWVLNTYVGEYVENLNTHQLSIALLQGAVELENLPLKKDALKSLGLPLQVKSGFIGKITLQIPLRRFHSEPWTISIERVYLVAGPLKNVEYDEDREKANNAARKIKMLEALEAKLQAQKEVKQESSWFSYGTSVVANILENLQLNIKDVHIRYEDDVTNPSCPFSFGVVIKNLSAQSTDKSWTPKFVSRDNVELMHKLVDLQNFSLYFDTNTILVGHLSKDQMTDNLQRDMYISSITKEFKDHEYILSPVSGKAKMKRFTTSLPLRDKLVPRNNIDLNLENMAFSLSEIQYRNVVLLLREFEKYEKSKPYRKWRPNCPVTNNAKKWWQFAINANFSRIQDRNRRLRKDYVIQRVEDILTYVRIYTSHLKKENIDNTLKEKQREIEEEWTFDEIKIVREYLLRNLIRQDHLSKAPSSTEPEPGTIKSADSPTESKPLLQRWFQGWGGWYGSKQESETSLKPAEGENDDGPSVNISKSELEQELKDEMDFVLGDGEDDKSVLKRDAVFAKLNFCLNNGSFKVLGNKTIVETGDIISYSILELECSAIEMMFESRPRTGGLTFGLNVGGLRLLDKITEYSQFPCLIGSQNKERFGLKRHLGTPRTQTSSKITPVQEETDEKLLALKFEKNPFQTSANFRFSILTQPLDIVYSTAAFRRVKEVFSSKNIYVAEKSERVLSSARRQYETLTRRTQAEFKHSLTRILEGSEKAKRWEINLDVSAPQIIIPENFVSDNTSMVVLDLGHLKFHNTQTGTLNTESTENNEDEFLTPMSTPPNEPEDSSQIDSEQFSHTKLSESQLYSTFYDQYTLELTDLQVMTGKKKDNWKHIHDRNTTPLHIVDRFTITLLLERRLIYTADPRFPTVKVTGNLPSFTVHVNEQKVHIINACLESMSTTSDLNQNVKSSSQSLTKSSSDENIGELGETTHIDFIKANMDDNPEKELKELHKESQLFLVEFTIRQVALKIQSRDRAVAELHVSGVTTSVTKRPYDTSVKLTVHSLQVIDALQTYGQDFELLVASHRNITMDSTSGSIHDSTTSSPMATSPRSPPGSPVEYAPPVTTSGGLQAVQDGMSRSYQALVNIVDKTQKATLPESSIPDSEALIVIEIDMIAGNSDCNTNTEGPLNTANLQFNNLNIIANQETVVEIVSFLKRTMYKSKPSGIQHSFAYNTSEVNQSMFAGLSNTDAVTSRTKLTANFNRLSVMMMRLDSSTGVKSARKVAMANMSCARVQASIGCELNMSGSLGGFHVYDVTPEHKHHRILFSAGNDSSQESVVTPQMFKTAHEWTVFDNEETKAVSFQFSKPLNNFSDKYLASTYADVMKVNLKVASLCYTHSPKTLNELSLCVSEFKEYWSSVAHSIKSLASEISKGMIAKRAELGQGQYLFKGSACSFKNIGGSRHKFNQVAEKTESEYFENVTFCDDSDDKETRIELLALFDTPIIVIPKNATSSNVLVAHLGQITVSNTDVECRAHLFEEVLSDGEAQKPNCIDIAVRNMNLYSVDVSKSTKAYKSSLNVYGSIDYRSLTMQSDVGTPIMFDTTVHVTINHSAKNTSAVNVNAGERPGHFQPKDINYLFFEQEKQPLLDIRAKIQTPLKLVLQKSVYEQILQTSDYISSTDDNFDQTYSNVNQNTTNGDSLSKNSTGSQDGPSQSDSFSASTESKMNHSQTSKSFVSNKFQLEVPLFSVEMRGDFGEEERLVAELKLHRFFFDFLKDNPATTKIEVTLKSLEMDDLLENPDSPHRQIMVSKAPKKKGSIRPSLASPAFAKGRRMQHGVGPNTSPRFSRSQSHDEFSSENLVYISVLLIDKATPEYKNKYKETQRFIDVDFDCLYTNINQQTWVVLLDFLGLGAKVHDVDILAGKAADPKNKPVNPEKYEQSVVNTEIKLKIENLSIVLNKPEYQLSQASISKVNSHLQLRDGNFHIKGQLGKICVFDLSPSGKLYRERFLTVGDQALEFDFFKFGVPDPFLLKDFEMKLKLRMSSVRYTHTNKFQAEMLGFVQHFLQLQDVLGRMRAASAGIKINEETYHQPRILFDIEAGSPIILIPHSSKTTDVLVADLGRLSVKNCFKKDGDSGTLNAEKQSDNVKTPLEKQSKSGFDRSFSRQSASRSNYQSSRRSINNSIEMSSARSTVGHKCLLDVLDVRLCDMDLFAAERVEKRYNKGKNLQKDLEFPSCVIQRQGCKLLKEKCMLNLQIERNLEGDYSHAVPDFRVQGALSTVHCCLDIDQYKLIRGLLDHNFGETFKVFRKEHLTHMQNPITVLSGKVWTLISLAVDLNNVTVELLTSHKLDNGKPEISLAKLDFVCTRLSYDLFSDQSKETDIISKEILISDTRFRDMAINLKPSVFEKILQPTKNARPDNLQLELHYRATVESTGLKVIINNMKLLCSFDWITALQQFISTKPDNPFFTDSGDDNMKEVQSPTLSSSSKGSRTTSPLMTKRAGSRVEQTEVPFELKLMVQDTEFVVVENLASADTNAVILKCTSELSYRPNAKDKLLSCKLQSLEIFSCSLQAEEETALSIVDPMSVTIELIPNPLPIVQPNTFTAGLVDAAVSDLSHMLLDIHCKTMNVRLSYQDMKMFLAITDSLSKQALQAKKPDEPPVSQFTEAQVTKLMDMNFSREDCLKSLKLNKENLEEAAVWLTENAKVVKAQKDDSKITAVEVKMTTFCLCLIDDCLDADVPLIQLNFYGIDLKYEPGREGKAGFKIAGDYYNRTLLGWEPLIEEWKCHAQWKNYKQAEEKLAIKISAPGVLNINATSTLLELYNMTKDKWTEDYYKQKDGSPKNIYSPSGAKRRQLFTPYAVRNHTGSPIWFAPVTVNPSLVGADTLKYSEQRLNESEMICVPPNQEKAFSFQRKEKIRHKNSSSLVVNQLIVKVDGWQGLRPVSVDKVGVYFRHILPDVNKPSITKVNDQQEARIVFDIQQEGSARKVITLRSALMVANRLDTPIEIKMDSPVFPGLYDYIKVSSSQQKSIPMPFVSCRLWIKPSDWPVDHSNEPISWQHIKRPGEVETSLRECKMPDSDAVFRYCAAVRRDNFPEESVQVGLSPLPGHTIVIMPPVTIVNLLPIDLRYHFMNTEISGDVKPGKKAQIPAADLRSQLEFGISLENFHICRECVIPSGTKSNKVKLRLYDAKDRLLKLDLKILCQLGGSLKLIIRSPYWIVNNSGLPLVFCKTKSSLEAAGQFDENEMVRIISPLLFSFTKFKMRVGKNKHGPNAKPIWSSSFSLKKKADVCQLHVTPKDGNRPDWLVSAQFNARKRFFLPSKCVQVYNMGIETKPGKGQFRHTSIVTVSPRYQIDNMSEHKLAVAQMHFTKKEVIHNPGGQLTVIPNCKLPFNWPRQDLDQLLCVKLLDMEECNWSGGFRIDSVNSFHINMRDGRKNSILLKVEVLLKGPTFSIIFSDADETPPPFRIDNMSEVPVLYFQTKTTEERLRAYVRPQASLPYAWDEPTLDPYMTLAVANGTTATYNLDVLGKGEQLSYQNYLYICATKTIPRGDGYSEKHSDLVLDCEHNYVTFRKKEAGKRSQLWRMTSSGMLEHEGTEQLLDPRKCSISRPGQIFVLDIADIVSHRQGRPVALTLKKADDWRAAKQTWRFMNGMLCSSTGNFCVQAVNDNDGLHDGALAILGPGPVEGFPVPASMQISCQALHPGSGCLTVQIKMDGPVRVVQINDVKQQHIRKMMSKDDDEWEIYEESLNQNTNEKRKKPVQKLIELDVNLKGGVGLSLVNKVPEELLYITLKNITLSYRSSQRGTTLEMNVANIQADNQLFGASRTVMLFVTPSLTRDVVENTNALIISAHKLPNEGWNAEIYNHLIISMKNLTVQLEEELLWKLAQFAGIGQSDQSLEILDEGIDDLQKTLSRVASVKTKRFYFGNLRIEKTCITLSMLTASGGLPADLASLKKTMGIFLVNFENAEVDIARFSENHTFESKEFFMNELKKHFEDELTGQAIKIIGSADFLGNPLGLVNDVSEGFSGLIEEGNVDGLTKGVFHGLSNCFAKMTGSLSGLLSKVHMDNKHNTKRKHIRSSATSGEFMAGLRGLGHGFYGGVKSVTKPFEGAAEGGIGGFGKGLYQGVTGIVTKPVAGVLDFASGMSNAVRDASRRSSHMQPARVRHSRCCHGTGGLLPAYSLSQAESQALLYRLNDHSYDEVFIASELLRDGQTDTLHVMITSHQVFFLKILDHHKENITLNIKHGDYTQCNNFENDGRFYVEIYRKDNRSSNRHSSNKKPQIRCNTKSTAQKVAQHINYAKNLFDEKKMSISVVQEEEEQF